MAPLRGSHSVFLEMEFAATTITVWLNWMRCQSFRTSIDQLTGSHSDSPGKYNRDYGFPQDSWSSTGDSWRKQDCESMESHPAKICQKCCYRLASLWFGLGLQTGQIWFHHPPWSILWLPRVALYKPKVPIKWPAHMLILFMEWCAHRFGRATVVENKLDS